jgi:DNA polymerase
LDRAADPDLLQAEAWARAVRTDAHRMRAFLRFLEAGQGGAPVYVGWYEPEHYTLETTAGLLAGQFGEMRWSIVTPYRSAHWDGAGLRFGPGAEPAAVPSDAALEAHWRAHYAFVFDAALPRQDWSNQPDPAALSDLMRAAGLGAEAMLEQELRSPKELPLGPVRMRSREAGPGAAGASLAEAAQESAHCRRCHLWERATQTVFGEGPAGAQLMLIGEQPGDQEDVIGRPFVGPAGRLLDRALEEAGIDRRTVYVTNAVKHFKFEPRGKRRIHQKPEGPEIVACKHWLDIERAEVRPALMVLMGATAARAVMGRTVTIGRERGRPIAVSERETALVTVHPSFLLRLPDEEAKAREYRAFVADLRQAKALAEDLAKGR